MKIKNNKGELVEATQNQKTFLLVDWNNLLFKYFYTMPLTKDQEGFYNNGILWFFKGLRNAIYNVKPDYLMIALDTKETLRKKIDPNYKAQRKETEEELKQQIERLPSVLESMGFMVYKEEGYEADDVIASVIKRNKDNKNFKLVICSSDKDFKQLLDDNVVIYNHQKIKYGDIKFFYTVEDFIGDYGFTPNQFGDYLAIVGDSADNVKGLTGVGEKGAENLIKTYGDIPWIYNNIDNIKGALNRKLTEGLEGLLVSKELVSFMEANIPKMDNKIILDTAKKQKIIDYITKYSTP